MVQITYTDAERKKLEKQEKKEKEKRERERKEREKKEKERKEKEEKERKKTLKKKDYLTGYAIVNPFTTPNIDEMDEERRLSLDDRGKGKTPIPIDQSKSLTELPPLKSPLKLSGEKSTNERQMLHMSREAEDILAPRKRAFSDPPMSDGPGGTFHPHPPSSTPAKGRR
jgi:hypothetical protein